ncbi:Protein ALP1-like [Holothuria leucospilota]|uniref:Protein ALP1-like n=1 Tax=Holothuria leucospilota TaxID=206669 RepID=A0A9Q1CB65_HOLLE|nr:Protein ALP1-like [Holothuria leucospilota]
MALVDANLQFICIDVGTYGRNNDGGVFANSNLGKGMATNRLNLPDNSTLPEGERLWNVPYVFVGDQAFPLQKHILHPYPGRGCPHDEQIFNMRLSRARRIVENCFGILAARWRVYHTKIAVRAEWVNDIVKATCALHNSTQRVGNRAGVEAIRCRELFKFFCNIAPVDWQEAHVTRGIFVERNDTMT